MVNGRPQAVPFELEEMPSKKEEIILLEMSS